MLGARCTKLASKAPHHDLNQNGYRWRPPETFSLFVVFRPDRGRLVFIIKHGITNSGFRHDVCAWCCAASHPDSIYGFTASDWTWNDPGPGPAYTNSRHHSPTKAKTIAWQAFGPGSLGRFLAHSHWVSAPKQIQNRPLLINRVGVLVWQLMSAPC